MPWRLTLTLTLYLLTVSRLLTGHRRGRNASLARICLPERAMDFFVGLQAQAMSVVQTAYGPTEQYLVEAGYRQGSLNGPNGFNIFQDILVSMQAVSPDGYSSYPTHPRLQWGGAPR